MKVVFMGKINRRFIWLSVVLACMAIGATALVLSPAQALLGSISLEPADNGSGVKRNVFDLIIKEGEVVEDSIYVRNLSNEAVQVFIFPSGYELKNNQIVSVLTEGEMRDEPGTWIELEKSEIILSPQVSKKVNFKVRVPEDIDVGDHMGTLFAQARSVKSQTKGTGMSINVRNGVRVYMTVPGEIDRTLIIDKIRHYVVPFWKLFTKKLIFAITFRNEGNVTLKPEVDITVRGLFGEVGEQTGAQYVKLRRGQTQVGQKEWIRRAPYFGRFVADFAIHLGERKQINEDGTETMLPDEIINARYVFWVLPWIEIIYLAIIIFLLYLLRSLWLYLVIVRRLKTKTKLYTAVKNDTLTKIASKFGVDPRVLAKFNMMRWPYEVRAGDRLLIPVGRMVGAEWHTRRRDILSSRDIMGGILGHLFRRRSVRKLTDKFGGEAREDIATVIVERGDTIQDVAKFAGTSIETIAELNNLRLPYRLRTGCELFIPKKSTSQAKRKSAKRSARRRRKK